VCLYRVVVIMKRYVLTHGITGQRIGKRYTTRVGCELAAIRHSANLPHTLNVQWLNDAGVAKVTLAYAYRGALTRTDE